MVAMQAKKIPELIREGHLPKTIAQFGHILEDIFVASEAVKQLVGPDYFTRVQMEEENHEASNLAGALGVYGYYQRLSQGLRQLMAGARKFRLNRITRDNLRSVTKEAEEITGIPSFQTDANKVLESMVKP